MVYTLTKNRGGTPVNCRAMADKVESEQIMKVMVYSVVLNSTAGSEKQLRELMC